MNYLDKFRLDKKITLVTGGAGGIGMEICKALLDAKSIVILADIDEKKSNKFIKSLKKNKKKIIFFKLDATSEKNINDLKKFIYKKYKKLNHLFVTTANFELTNNEMKKYNHSGSSFIIKTNYQGIRMPYSNLKIEL